MSYQSKRLASRKTVARRVGAVATTLALVGTSVPAAALVPAVTRVALADEDLPSTPGLYIGDDSTGIETKQETGKVELFSPDDENKYMFYVGTDGTSSYGVNFFNETDDKHPVEAYYDASKNTLDVKIVTERDDITVMSTFIVWKDKPGGEIDSETSLSYPIKLDELKTPDGKRCSLDIRVQQLRYGLFLEDDDSTVALESGELTAHTESNWYKFYTADGQSFGVDYDAQCVKAVYDAAAQTITFSALNKDEGVKVEWNVSEPVEGSEPYIKEQLGAVVKLDELKPEAGKWCGVWAEASLEGLFIETYGDEGSRTRVTTGPMPQITDEDSGLAYYRDGDNFNIGFDSEIEGYYDEEAGTFTFTASPAYKIHAGWGEFNWKTGERSDVKELASGFGTLTIKIAELPEASGETVVGNLIVRAQEPRVSKFWWDDVELAKETPGVEWSVRDDGTMFAMVNGKPGQGWITYGTVNWFHDGEETTKPARRYLVDGVPVVGLYTIDGEDYIFDNAPAEDNSIPGWLCVDDSPALRDETTGLLDFYKTDGWGRTIKNHFWTAPGEDGQETVYLGEDGKRAMGWKYIEGDTYYFDDEAKEFQTMVGKQKFATGFMFTGEHTINGQKYTFASNGKLIGDSPIKPDDPVVPLADPDPTALKERKDLWVASGHDLKDFQHWVDLGIGPDGDTMWATYDANGELVTNRWLNFTKPSGSTYKIYAEDWYYVDGFGKMLVGFQTLEFGSTKETYYFNPIHDGTYGRMLAGWHQIDGDWYYFSELHDGTYGKMVKNQWVGDWHVGADGKWDGSR